MLLDRHRAKIVAPEALAQMLGPRPRGGTVAMCHGVFDVVHVGHLRHLLYVRRRADVLVCSITSDAHADRKGPHRPHVPQDLRAANLAILDVVDYVVVCDADRPDDLIRLLQPDLYAKGFEYSPDSRPEPVPEAAAVAEAGGEVLFTPGDVVYSSTTLIEAAAPDLRWDKLAMVMEQAGLTFAHLRGIVQQMAAQRVHVVGDVIVDRITRCGVIGTSGKTPTLSVRRHGPSEDFAGGAAVVARHARATGADVTLTTIIGDDEAGQFVLSEVMDAGIRMHEVVDQSRPTTVKEVFAAGQYRMLKVDVVDSRPVSDAVACELAGYVERTYDGAILFSDFRHGIFNPRSIPTLTEAIPAQCLRAADSQVASRWGNVADFVGFDLLTPNEREARHALGDQDSGVRPLAARLREVAGARFLLMKLGERGMIGFGPDDASLALDSLAVEVRDAVGAGDAFLAYATLALLVRPSLAAAAILGSAAAGVACAYEGNVPVAPEAVLARLDEAEREIGE